MLRSAWFITRSDLRNMLKQRETIVWTFLMPPVFFFFIGTVTGGFSGSSDSGPELIALDAPTSAGPLADHVEARLLDQGFEVVRGTGADSAPVSQRVILPAGFSDSLIAGNPVTVTLDTESDAGIDARYDEVRVTRAVYTVLADLVVAPRAGEQPNLDSLRAFADRERLVTLEVTQAGERKEIPSGFEQAVPGTMVMFTLLVMLTSGAVLLVIERNGGLLRRLASTPLPRSGIVLGKWGGRMTLGLVQIGFAVLIGTLFFKMRWGPDLPMLILVLLAWGALAAVLGLLLGNLARTQGQAVGLGVLFSNLLAAMGGCWWPIEVTPQWMQRFALTLPTGWTMDALHNLISFEAGARSALPHLTVLILATVVFGWLATRTFRFQ